jgi:Tfp pilus assembly protein PilF
MFLAVLFTVLLCYSHAEGQGGVGINRADAAVGEGAYAIKGRIQVEDNSELARLRFRISLEGSATDSRSTVSDSDGAFAFNRLVAGNYTIVITGENNYQTTREFVVIQQAGAPVSMVQIFVRRKPTADPAFAGIPKSALEAYAKGMEAVEKQDDKKATEQFTKAIAEYPNFSQALSELGTIYLKQKDYDKAAETLKKAVEAKSDSFDAHYNYGAALYYKKDMPGAEAEFRKAIQLRETSALAHMYLGLIVIQDKKYDEARAEFEKAVNLPGGDGLWQAHRYLGGLYMSTDPKRAADELEKYLQLQPKAPDADRTRAAIKDLRAKSGG